MSVTVCKGINLRGIAARRWLNQFEAEQLGQSDIDQPLTAEHQRIRQRKSRQLRDDVEINILAPRSRVFAALYHSLLGSLQPITFEHESATKKLIELSEKT